MPVPSARRLSIAPARASRHPGPPLPPRPSGPRHGTPERTRESVQNLGVGGLSTPPGEKPMQREAGPTAVAVTSRFRSPPRFWTVSPQVSLLCHIRFELCRISGLRGLGVRPDRPVGIAEPSPTMAAVPAAGRHRPAVLIGGGEQGSCRWAAPPPHPRRCEDGPHGLARTCPDRRRGGGGDAGAAGHGGAVARLDAELAGAGAVARVAAGAAGTAMKRRTICRPTSPSPRAPGLAAPTRTRAAPDGDGERL